MCEAQRKTEIKSEQELMNKLATLGDLDDGTRNSVACSLLGHSKIQTGCFGYYYCSRCGELMGDAIGGFYPMNDIVIVGHNCPTCRDNYEKLNWRDKLFTPHPFSKEVECDE